MLTLMQKNIMLLDGYKMEDENKYSALDKEFKRMCELSLIFDADEGKLMKSCN